MANGNGKWTWYIVGGVLTIVFSAIGLVYGLVYNPLDCRLESVRAEGITRGDRFSDKLDSIKSDLTEIKSNQAELKANQTIVLKKLDIR